MLWRVVHSEPLPEQRTAFGSKILHQCPLVVRVQLVHHEVDRVYLSVATSYPLQHPRALHATAVWRGLREVAPRKGLYSTEDVRGSAPDILGVLTCNATGSSILASAR